MSILTNELHYINFNRVAPGFFSCAIDCFLETYI